jgi:hypothetical protein
MEARIPASPPAFFSKTGTGRYGTLDSPVKEIPMPPIEGSGAHNTERTLHHKHAEP